MKRILALAAAIAMVAVALWIRERGDGGGGGGGGDGGDDEVVVVCITELADACEELEAEVRVQSAGDTLDALVAGDADFDVWVTLDPWPDIAIEARAASTLGEPEPVASTELVLVGFEPRTIQLNCQPLSWSCLAEADAPIALPPTEEGLGLVLLGYAASGFFGETTFAANDFADPDFEEWHGDIKHDDDPLGRFLFERTVGFVDAVGATAAAFEAVADTQAAIRLVRADPEPQARAVVVAATVAGGDRVDLSPLRDALVESGWNAGPAEPNLPSAGVLLGLLRR